MQQDNNIMVNNIFRLTGQDVDDIGGVKAIVMRQSKSFIKMQPKKGCEVRPLPKEITFHKPEVAPKKRGKDFCHASCSLRYKQIQSEPFMYDRIQYRLC